MATTWTEGIAEDVHYDSDAGYDEEEEQAEDLEYLWANAETVHAHETDFDGRHFELVKKVRKYHVDRAATPADIRAKLKPFGKAVGDQSVMMSHEPPIALEMGTVDQYERESRAEVKRMLHEVSTMKVTITDPNLAIVEKEEAAKRERERTAATTGSGGGGGSTWGSTRATGQPKDQDRRDDANLRIRVSNMSDDISREHLESIFSTDGWEVTNVYVVADKSTGQSRGFAFVTFKEMWMAEAALSRGRYQFKNVVLKVVPASDRKQ